MNTQSGKAVAVLIITPQGIPLIRDPKKPPPLFWKVPGGRGNAGETAQEAAIREINEELGITLPPNELSLIREEDRGSHTLFLFTEKIPVLPAMRTVGEEGEEIKVFLPQDILAMPDFFPNHRRAYEKIIEGIVTSVVIDK